MFDAVAPLFGENITADDLYVEASLYSWSLMKTASFTKKTKDGITCASVPAEPEDVSANFPKPHRDNGFDDACFADGRPKLLTVWMPINDVRPAHTTPPYFSAVQNS